MNAQEDTQSLQRIYRRRFGQTADYCSRVWQLLTTEFCCQWIKPEAIVLDFG